MTVKKRKPRICILHTGGTIGMVRYKTPGGDVLRPAQDAQEFLKLVRAEDEARSIADIEFRSILNKDSTNMVPDDWTTIAKAVHERMHEGFDGFVITHGTDTMHFTSSALAFAFGRNLNVPIVLTGAQATPEVSHGDARVNLLRAVKVASEKSIHEVVVAFGDYVFRGCRVQKKDERKFDAFESPAEFPLGYITEQIILSTFVRSNKSDQAAREADFKPYFADGIVQISLIPGLQPELLSPILEKGGCRGIVLQSFGAGNVPNEGKYSFDGFIASATERGIPVVIASQFPANSTLASHYEPGKAAVEAGAIPTGNMTNAAATVKFRWLMHQLESDKSLSREQRLQQFRRLMNKDFVGEVTESRGAATK